MKVKNLLKTGILLSGVLLFAASCSNSNDASQGTITSLTNTSTDNATSGALSDEVVNNTENAIAKDEASSSLKSQAMESGSIIYFYKHTYSDGAKGTSFTITRDTVALDTTFYTIDYGTTGYINRRGNTLKGVIKVKTFGSAVPLSLTRVLTFANFSINGNQISGKKTVSIGLNSSNQLQWSIVANDSITKTDKTLILWKSTRTRALNPSDSTFVINGSSSGVSAAGNAYTDSITSPLILKLNYPFFVKGTVVLKSETKTVTVDYGDGTEDNKATVTIDGKSHDITLKY
jgi:hypothetical protein